MGKVVGRMAKRVLVTEAVDKACTSILRSRGIAVDVKLGLDTDQLKDIIGQYDGMIVRSHTQVTRELIEAAVKLKVIGRAGVSVDNIDVEAATDHNVIVCNAPNSNIVSAAELAMGLIIAASRSIPQANEAMHHGVWDRAACKGTELYEKTLAIFGLGRVGGLVAQRAAAFGMKLIGYDPYCSRDRATALGVELYDSIDEVLPQADYITVHMPKTEETTGMFGPLEFAKMKDGVIVINVARGGIYDEKALSDFIAAGKVRAVGVDVFEGEPVITSPLHEFDQAILTPHIGADTSEAQRRAGAQIANYVALGLAGSVVPTAVNLTTVPPEVVDVAAPYVPACQLMGSMAAQLNRDTPQYLGVTAAGRIATSDIQVFVASTLKGILDYKEKGVVTPKNAEEVAHRHGIAIEASTTAASDGYSSSLTITADDVELAITVADPQRPARLVSLFGYRFDLVPGKRQLIFRYSDAPGRIGVIGTILGEHGINITTMQIGKRSDIDSALVFMNVEGDLDDAVLDELRESIDGLEDLWYIVL